MWNQRLGEKEDVGEETPDTQTQTFPESSEPFLSGDGLVGINSALVSPATSSLGLGLEPYLYYICGLGHSHSQGTCGAACQEAAPDAGICGKTVGVSAWGVGLTFHLSSPKASHLWPFGNRIQISSCSKNSLHQRKVTL